MSKQIWKRSYCASCRKNVPHWRRKAQGLREVVLSLLERIQVGRWHCMHCQCTRYLLPSVDEDAEDYRVVKPRDAVDPSKPAIWSRSTSATGEPNVGSDSPVDNLDQKSAHNAALESSVEEDFDSNRSRQESEERFAGRRENVFRGDADERLPEQEIKTGIILDADADLCDVNSNGSRISLGADEARNVVSTENEPIAHEEIPELIEVFESEPAGNFIKDQSLAVNATRILRFSEKYRDAVVDRILSGNATIRSLIEDGKYTEAELVSWVADKAKRHDSEIETIDLDVLPRKSK